jgi:hypothetical protein
MTTKKHAVYGILAMVSLLGLGITQSAKANLVNGSFETGDFTGWTVGNAGLSSVVTTTNAFNGTPYNPVDGNYFARLDAGGGAGVYTLVSQGFSLTAGNSISGYAAFLAFDYLPFNDNAFVRILDSSNNIVATPWSASVATVGDFGNTPWQSWNWTALTSGSYFVEFGVDNELDNALSSVALFDANTMSSIPDAGSTLPLLGFALAGLGILRRKLSCIGA